MPERRSRRKAVLVLFIALTVIVTLALFEGFLVALRRVPALSATPSLRQIARELYMLDRAMIQFEAGAAQWDPRLGYILHPGTFRFSNTEFDTTCSVNSLGVRDDEQSLDRPSIVVIGDSFAMGWGVEQSEAFPSVIEGLSGARVLNTAIASYGTARQLRLLESVDLSQTTHLVIQFCNNDYFENLAFDREGPDFATVSRAGYAEAVASYRRGRRYFPGRYGITLLMERSRRVFGRPPRAIEPDPNDPGAQKLQAELFLQVLQRSRVDLGGIEIIVFELNAYNRHRGLFVPVLAEVIAEGDFPEYIRRMRVVDLASELQPEQFFRLDDHLTAHGHRFLARRIWKIISDRAESDATGRGTTTTDPGSL